MKEFSKRIVKWFSIVWFIGGTYGLLVGAYAVITEIATVDTVFNFLIAYIGAPVIGSILGYLCKAAFENVKKISKSDGENNENRLDSQIK